MPLYLYGQEMIFIGNNDFEQNDILKYAIENGIINLSYVQEKIEMDKRNSILENHQWAISQGKDGNWRTYLPDEKHGRRMIKRSTQKKIEAAVIDFYIQNQEAPKTFKDAYFHWREVQDNLISSNSIVKYNTDYKRYFNNTEFEKKEISCITEEDIKVFIVKSVKEKHLCKKACKTLFGYINNTVNSARINHLINENPMEFLQARQFYKYCEDRKKPIEKRIVSDSEMKLLSIQFQSDYRENPSYIPTYAVHLASLTGMRVGEISALSWDNIFDSYILIDKSEIYDRIEKKYYVGRTKNGKERIFPVTEEIRSLLSRVKKVEEDNGFLCEWVFANEKGRIHAPIISSCIKNKCKQAGVDKKGIHAFRRTVNSKLRCNGVSSTVAASLLGHTEEVNEHYYTFDVSSLSEKVEQVSKIHEHMF